MFVKKYVLLVDTITITILVYSMYGSFILLILLLLMLSAII